MTPKEARAAKFMSREALAARAKVSMTTVQRVESSGAWPKQLMVRGRYLRALGLSAKDVGLAVIVAMLAGLLGGCAPRAEVVTEGAHWNEPGSHAYRMVVGNTAYMDRILPPSMALGPHGEWGESYTAGFCSSERPYLLAVWEGAPGYVTRHEFCHLVDRFAGHWQDALTSLGGNVPAEILNFCIALSHCDPGSNYQWIELQRENPGVDVIGHPAILRSIHQYDIKPWKGN